ncbi:MAG TPA: hypothetical protein VGL77_19810 [Armatimonadota bacterium]|jgi:hypothetical protein
MMRCLNHDSLEAEGISAGGDLMAHSNNCAFIAGLVASSTYLQRLCIAHADEWERKTVARRALKVVSSRRCMTDEERRKRRAASQRRYKLKVMVAG